MRRGAAMILGLTAVLAGLALWASGDASPDARSGQEDVSIATRAARTGDSPAASSAPETAAPPTPVALQAGPDALAPQGATWRGLVLGGDGQPLGGARVGRLLAPRKIEVRSHGPAPSNPTLLQDAPWTETAADGTFSVAWEPPAPDADWMLIIRHPRAVSRIVPCVGALSGGGDAGTLRLATGGSVSGLVLRPDGQAATGAQVQLSARYDLVLVDGTPPEIVGLRDGLLRAVCDDSGRFVVAGLPAAAYRARIENHGCLPLDVESRSLAEGGALDLGRLQLRQG